MIALALLACQAGRPAAVAPVEPAGPALRDLGHALYVSAWAQTTKVVLQRVSPIEAAYVISRDYGNRSPETDFLGPLLADPSAEDGPSTNARMTTVAVLDLGIDPLTVPLQKAIELRQDLAAYPLHLMALRRDGPDPQGLVRELVEQLLD